MVEEWRWLDGNLLFWSLGGIKGDSCSVLASEKLVVLAEETWIGLTFCDDPQAIERMIRNDTFYLSEGLSGFLGRLQNTSTSFIICRRILLSQTTCGLFPLVW